VICALLGGIGWLLNGYSLFLIFLFAGLLVAAGLWWYADRAVLGLVRAHELPLGEAAGLHSLVERLAAQAGVSKPRLYVMRDGLPRACSAGRGPRSAAVAVSRGLLQALPPAELEAVLAHELAHIRHRDVFVQSVAVVTAAVIVETSRIGGWLTRWLLFVLGPVASAFVHLLLSPKREFDADRAAALLLKTPHGLASALVRLDQASDLVQFEGSPVAEPVYTINPFEQQGLAGLFSTHPPVTERVGRLRALDRDAPVLAA
jgi:heat shock protein HtpX